MSNLIATCGADGEVNILNITGLPAAPQTYKPSATSKHAGSEVLCVAWNRKVQHILASSSNAGMTCVWDLKQQKEVINFKDPAGRSRASSVAWNPDVPTQLLVAYDDDRNPSMQMWDLRNCQYPFKETRGHDKGILSVAWNAMDSNLLLSAGKDNRMICWNLSSGTPEIFSEVACPQMTFEAKWAPHKPSLLSAASFNGSVSIHSMQQTQSESRYCPKWYSKPSGVSFGFGGKMLSFGKKSTGTTSWCHSLLVPNEPEVVPAADAFESWMNEQKLRDYCVDKQKKSEGHHEELMWQVMAQQFESDSKTKLPALLGFDGDKILQKAEQFLGSKPGTTLAGPPAEQEVAAPATPAAAPPAPLIDANEAVDFFNQLTIDNEKKEQEELLQKEQIEKELADAAMAVSAMAVSKGNETTTDWSGGAELMIKESLLIGNLPAAVECCFKAGKMAEGLLLASGGGNALFSAARDEYLRLKGDAFLTSVGNIMTNDFEKLVANSNLSHWTETLAILATYSGDKYTILCEQLALRLEKEKFDTRSAVVCYICAGNFPKTVSIWTTQPSPGTQQRSLQDLVEKMAVLQDAVKFNQADTVFNAKLTQYADILANSGRLTAAMRYLLLLRDDTSSAILRDRIYNSAPRQMSQMFGRAPQFPFQSTDVRVTYRPPAPAAPQAQPQQQGYGAPAHPGAMPGHPGMPKAPMPGHPGMPGQQQPGMPHPGMQGQPGVRPPNPGMPGHPQMPGQPGMPGHPQMPGHPGMPGQQGMPPAPAPAPTGAHQLPPAPRMPTNPAAGPGVQPPGGFAQPNYGQPQQGMGQPGMGMPQPGMPQMPPNAGMGVMPPNAGAGVLPPGGMAAQQAGPPMGVGGPPPGQPPKLSTAPTASAMPVTDGMPTPWPLPTKTQQIRATNQAVAGSNQAVQDASANSGIAVMGDCVPPHEVQHVKSVMEMLLNNSAQDGNARKRDDIAKRLEELYTKLSTGMMKTAASQKVVQLVQAVEQNDFATANRIQMELCTVDWDVNKGWLMGVKRLLPTR